MRRKDIFYARSRFLRKRCVREKKAAARAHELPAMPSAEIDCPLQRAETAPENAAS